MELSDPINAGDDFDDGPLRAAGCRHPEIVVQLTGVDGGTGPIMSRVIMAMEEEGVDRREINEFRSEILFVGDYNAVLKYVMEWVSVA